MFNSNGSFLRPTHRLEQISLEKSGASHLVLVRLWINGPDVQGFVNCSTIETGKLEGLNLDI